MDMKKKILLSMILLALCLIQASAKTYYFKIKYYDEKGEHFSSYIEVTDPPTGESVYTNGLRQLLNGNTVKDEVGAEYTLPKKADNQKEVDLDKIEGIVFANGKGRDKGTEEDILWGDEYHAWETIRPYIKFLDLRKYIRDTYTGDTYFGDMHKVEKLELPENGMTVGNANNIRYFANADNLKEITIWNGSASVDITQYEGTVLQNSVGEYMFSNCYNLSTKYINRLIKGVTEIKDYAFKVDPGNRKYFPDDADHSMAIDIPISVTKIGRQAFYNRVNVTELNIQGNGGLEIGSEAFRGCEQLNVLNSKNAKITSLGTGVFGDCRSMTDEFVNGVLQNYAANAEIKKIPAYLFWGCNGQDGHNGTDSKKNTCTFTHLNIPAEFTVIGDGAFAYNGTDKNVIKLQTITVNRATAPTCLDNSGPTKDHAGDEYAGFKNVRVFNGLDPNLTTVIFDHDATGWKETENETTGFLTYMNDDSEFQRLLTKDIYSDHTEYINVPQQHAIVRLHRTLKVGWNTICLPFGVNYKYCSDWGEDYKAKQAYNARIVVNGLTHNDSEANSNNFTMGVYRGYWKEGKTFMFLHYTGFDDYPLDFCETFLVKMRSEDIAKAEKEKDDKGVHTYTFTNVDLNYRWHADGTSGNEGKWTETIYTAENMPQQVKPFYGNENKTEIPFQGKASYNEYVLKGSLVQRTGTVEDGTISTNDYFFQQTKDGKMKLYPYKAGQKYGIRGFSGWFHYLPNNSPSKASELSLSLFDDGSITPIETVKVDDLNRDTSGKVYSISGVLVKNNAADLNNLSKGIYVVNGKKYVVK